MINPKEKASELVQKFLETRLTIFTMMDSIPTKLSDYPDKETAKKCALICVDEILKSRKLTITETEYYLEVKNEIKIL